MRVVIVCGVVCAFLVLPCAQGSVVSNDMNQSLSQSLSQSRHGQGQGQGQGHGRRPSNHPDRKGAKSLMGMLSRIVSRAGPSESAADLSGHGGPALKVGSVRRGSNLLQEGGVVRSESKVRVVTLRPHTPPVLC